MTENTFMPIKEPTSYLEVVGRLPSNALSVLRANQKGNPNYSTEIFRRIAKANLKFSLDLLINARRSADRGLSAEEAYLAGVQDILGALMHYGDIETVKKLLLRTD